MELSKLERYEIEKCLDVQVGWLGDRLEKLCQIATNMCAMKRDTKGIDEQIRQLQHARNRYRDISMRFEKERLLPGG